MREYIDRETLISEMCSYHTLPLFKGHYTDEDIKFLEILSLVETARAADVAEVKYGQWENVLGVLTPGGDPLYRCPFCKSRESEHLNGIECRTVFNYCPKCGAKLEY